MSAAFDLAGKVAIVTGASRGLGQTLLVDGGFSTGAVRALPRR